MTWIVMVNNGLSVLSRSVLSPTLTCLTTIWHIFCVCFNNESPRSFMCRFNVGILVVFKWTCVDYTRFNNGSPRSFRRNSFFVKRMNIDLLRTGRFSSTLHGSRVIFNNGSPRSLTTLIWNWLVRLETSRKLSNFWSLSMFRIQFSSPFVFQGDLWWRPRWHENFLVFDFSNFHPNNFRNTISWKCFLKDDCIRSSLIELQSFPQSKIDVNPAHCVQMSFQCFVQVLCTTRYTQVNLVRILVTFVSRINRQEKYCLSLARILTSRYNPDGMQIDCTSDMIHVLEEVALNNHIVL